MINSSNANLVIEDSKAALMRLNEEMLKLEDLTTEHRLNSYDAQEQLIEAQGAVNSIQQSIKACDERTVQIQREMNCCQRQINKADRLIGGVS